MLFLYSLLSASTVSEGNMKPNTKAEVLLDFGFENQGKFKLVVDAPNITGTKAILMNKLQYDKKRKQIDTFQKYCNKNTSTKFISHTYDTIQGNSLLIHIQDPEIYYPIIINCNNISLDYVVFYENPNTYVDYREKNNVYVATFSCIVEFLITISWYYRTQAKKCTNVDLFDSFMFGSFLKSITSLISVIYWTNLSFALNISPNIQRIVEIVNFVGNTFVFIPIMYTINGMSLIDLNNASFQKLLANLAFAGYSATKYFRAYLNGYMYYVMFIVEVLPIIVCSFYMKTNRIIFDLISDIHKNNEKMKPKCDQLNIILNKITVLLYNVLMLDILAVVFHLTRFYLTMELEVIICLISFSCLYIFWNHFDCFESSGDYFDSQDPFDIITIRLSQIIEQMGRDMKANQMDKCLEGINEYENLIDKYNTLAEMLHQPKFPDNYRLKEMFKQDLQKCVKKLMNEQKSDTHQNLNKQKSDGHQNLNENKQKSKNSNKNENDVNKLLDNFVKDGQLKDDQLKKAIDDFVEDKLLKNPQNQQKSDKHQTKNESQEKSTGTTEQIEELQKKRDKELEILQSIPLHSNDNQLESTIINRNNMQNLDEFINSKGESEIEQMDFVAGKDRSLKFNHKRKKVLEEYKDRNIGRCYIC
ncbi:hypothetical protein TVAG_252450 [Trichomonas vaginalis G3]|uniref:Intimal thickness related receptor IRP domain-containing protein n=1 Tax=Trichomonas vaginalis (strain ATCC PRA-98 / G3) TaxID=412133 RepID=A2DVY7_TRIV3|nr:hypothetical protein TVAGG3_0845900 [Trichomonas vaginalis G3]EAY15432.1 hypothetical protein TVAG_252450 [Trichomonas vaginalis G3]KAI5499605.1 hypothetical protein TVAGG3_0845900 [Trichomonas vaginalis G3]|eukprot:XP_001327655.1 hypothetical protein [Trichomonas vaginalis G3]